ncbi:MAG: carbohydrate ABC transporter permease [Candidatus Woesearchaeota archaeon]
MLDKILYNKKIAPYLFIAPFLILFIIFKIGPIIYSIGLSFFDMQGLAGAEFVGISNYIRLINDGDFWNSVFNNTKYMLGTMVTLIPIPIIFAVLLDSKKCRGKGIFRAILFLPVLTSLVVAAAVFQILFREGRVGIINSFIGLFGFSPKDWLSDPSFTLLSVLIVATWRWMGLNVVYFTTGLTGIPVQLYEAASIDGANKMQSFIYITLPLLKPIILFVMTLNIIGGYQLFAEVYTLFGSGTTTPRQSATTMALYLYRQAFSYMDMGYASTIGVAMAVIILAITLIQFKFFGTLRK